ncbi:MAG: DHH family phosphoesterase [Flavobacteriales bacterium]|nr:DHH family phosphoesterase [Flavobacteriales bacterium]
MPKSLSPDQIKTSQDLIKNAQHIVVTSHKNPDGDAAGSAFSMSLFLRALGKMSPQSYQMDCQNFCNGCLDMTT